MPDAWLDSLDSLWTTRCTIVAILDEAPHPLTQPQEEQRALIEMTRGMRKFVEVVDQLIVQQHGQETLDMLKADTAGSA